MLIHLASTTSSREAPNAGQRLYVARNTCTDVKFWSHASACGSHDQPGSSSSRLTRSVESSSFLHATRCLPAHPASTPSFPEAFCVGQRLCSVTNVLSAEYRSAHSASGEPICRTLVRIFEAKSLRSAPSNSTLIFSGKLNSRVPVADKACANTKSSISTARLVSWALKAQRTWRSFLWPAASRRPAAASSALQTTGTMIVPSSLFGESRMARPTAWTMSTSDWRGSTNATPSRAGTSTPSVRHRAFASKLKPVAAALSRSIRRWRSFAETEPST